MSGDGRNIRVLVAVADTLTAAGLRHLIAHNLGHDVLVAHDLAVVKNVCDRICVMERGRFVDVGPAEQVFESPTSDYTRRLLAAVPRIEG